MFRRSNRAADAAPETPVKPGGKGRPTPSRREAEAAAKARAKAPRTRKELAAAQRAARADAQTQTRKAMQTGDDRYLPARDRGPVKRFIRDYIDSRFQFIQIVLPVMIVAAVLPYVSGSARALQVANVMSLTSLLLVAFDLISLRLRLRRELASRFPGDQTRGTTLYAVMRSMQPKFMRMPKPQVKIGQQLPETYR